MRFGWSLWRCRTRQVQEQQNQGEVEDKKIIAQIVDRLFKIGPADTSGDGENPFDDENAALFEARQVADCMENGVEFVFSPRLVAGLTRAYHVYVPPHVFKSERRILFL